MRHQKSARAPRKWGPLSISLFLVASPLLAQTGNTIFQAVPNGLSLGGVVDLYVAGAGSALRKPVVASGFPLPTVLAGISVSLTQVGPPQQIQVPILAVNPLPACTSNNLTLLGPPCGSYVVITIEIPQEAAGNVLTVTENGTAGSPLRMNGGDLVRVLAITHADGTPISPGALAKAGEELVVWATNLGDTVPTVPTGQATPSPAPVSHQVRGLNLDFRPNAAPSRPYCATSANCPLPQPVFAGLTPSYAGLYQINFIVPQPPPGTPPCNDESLSISNLANVAANLTVSVLTLSWFDGAGICVDTTVGGSSGAGSAVAPLADTRTRRTVSVPDSIWFPRDPPAGRGRE